MARTQIPMAQGFYVDESRAISAQECVNLYPHIPFTKTITDASLIGSSGIALRAFTATNAFNRGGYVMAETAYTVNANKLYKITYTTDSFGVRTYTATNVSGAETIDGTEFVQMADNGTQLCIIAPDQSNQFNAWIYTEAGGLVQISDADFDGPVNSVCYFNGYFVFSKKNSNKFFVSALRDGLTYNALDFGSGESDPDDNVIIRPLDGLLYVFGNHTFEQWQDAGLTNGIPFQRTSNGNQQKGCFAPLSMTYFNESLIWIGSSFNERAAIWATNGSDAIKLSTPAIDYLINSGGVEPLRKAFALRWAERGHNFVAFTIPDICTVVYDAVTQLWHEKKSVDRFGQPTPWRATSLMNAYSVYLVGDNLTGNIGEFGESIFYEYSDEIRRYFTAAAIDNGGRPFSVNAVELFCDTGHVPESGQGSAPIIRLSISKDFGNTYTPEISRTMGLLGQYNAVTNWSLLGRYRKPVIFRWDISEPIKIAIVKAEAEIAA